MDSPLTELARDPTFIPLVYNYCDMWCERCRLTGRCLLFAAERLVPDTNRTASNSAVAAALDVAETIDRGEQPPMRLPPST